MLTLASLVLAAGCFSPQTSESSEGSTGEQGTTSGGDSSGAVTPEATTAPSAEESTSAVDDGTTAVATTEEAESSSGSDCEGEDCETCLEGMRRCLDANTPERCNAVGVWEPEPDCEGDAPVCDEGVCQCEEAAHECLGAQLMRTCTDGAWVEDTCTNPTPYCEDTVGECVTTHSAGGAISCDVPTDLVCTGGEVCCWFDNPDSHECTTVAGCPQQPGTSNRFECDGHADCPGGQSCCLRSNPGGRSSSCGEASSCTSSIYFAAIVCDPDGDDCEAGETCTATNEFYPDVYYCT